MNWRLHTAIVAAVAVSLAAGIFVGKPPSARAITYQYDVYNQPDGPSSLTCGWHGVCEGSANDGWALDWAGSSPPFYVYFRSYSSNGAGSTWAGQGSITYGTTNNGVCNHTWVDIWDKSGTHFEGEVHHAHVYSGYTGYRFTINSGYLPTWTEYYFGYTVSEPNDPCHISAQHVHQEKSSSGEATWVKHTTLPTYPTMAQCSGSCGTFSVSSTANWQMKATFYQ